MPVVQKIIFSIMGAASGFILGRELFRRYQRAKPIPKLKGISGEVCGKGLDRAQSGDSMITHSGTSEDSNVDSKRDESREDKMVDSQDLSEKLPEMIHTPGIYGVFKQSYPRISLQDEIREEKMVNFEQNESCENKIGLINLVAYGDRTTVEKLEDANGESLRKFSKDKIDSLSCGESSRENSPNMTDSQILKQDEEGEEKKEVYLH